MPDIAGRNIRFVLIKPCEKALHALSKQQPSPIPAMMNVFAEEWNRGTSQDVLRARYDFKRVGTDNTCRQEAHLYQVRLGRTYRGLMTFAPSRRTCYWLDVFVKNPTDQNNHIRTACDRALRLQERDVS